MFDFLLPENPLYFPAESYVYALPYLLLGVLVLLIGYKKIWTNNIQPLSWGRCAILVLLFLFFFGLRWHIMSDTLAYEQEYQQIVVDFSWSSIERQSWWWDKGFLVFAMLCKALDIEFTTFITINSIIDCVLLSLCIRKYSVNIPITCLAFLAFNGILIEFNLMRNIKAILLFFYSLSYVRQKQLIPFLTCNGIGCLFHMSAFIFIPLYWVINRCYSVKLLVCICISATVIMVVNDTFLSAYMTPLIGWSSQFTDKVMAYAENSDSRILSLGTLERILTLSVAIYVYHKTKKERSMYVMFLNIYVVFYCVYSLFLFNEVFADRFSTLLVPSYWFLYPYIFIYMKRIRYAQVLILVLFFMKIFASTHISSAYYENRLFPTTTRRERCILLNKNY